MSNQQHGDVDDPAFAEAGREYLRRLVVRYREHPALDSWILWNEPGLNLKPNATNVEAFRSFLRDQYQTIESLNARYYGQYESFDQVEFALDSHDAMVPAASTVQRMDWWRFRLDHLTRIVGTYARTVRERDPVHPVHVNPHNSAANTFASGQSVWRLGHQVDFLGCSAFPCGIRRDSQRIALPSPSAISRHCVVMLRLIHRSSGSPNCRAARQYSAACSRDAPNLTKSVRGYTKAVPVGRRRSSSGVSPAGSTAAKWVSGH